jgi:hypothetical protein
MAGKGDKPRAKDGKKYRDSWDRIFRKSADKKTPISKQKTIRGAKPTC